MAWLNRLFIGIGCGGTLLGMLIAVGTVAAPIVSDAPVHGAGLGSPAK